MKSTKSHISATSMSGFTLERPCSEPSVAEGNMTLPGVSKWKTKLGNIAKSF